MDLYIESRAPRVQAKDYNLKFMSPGQEKIKVLFYETHHSAYTDHSKSNNPT